MANKTKFQAIKGTRDLLPPETELWNRVEQTAREVFGTFGFGEIRLPIFEPTELFARAVGVETDIVSKEMYSFEDPTLCNLEEHEATRSDNIYSQSNENILNDGDNSRGAKAEDIGRVESTRKRAANKFWLKRHGRPEWQEPIWKEFQVAVFNLIDAWISGSIPGPRFACGRRRRRVCAGLTSSMGCMRWRSR